MDSPLDLVQPIDPKGLTAEIGGNFVWNFGLGIDGRDLQAFLEREAGNVHGLIKKTAAGSVEPVGGRWPSKEVWETLR